MSFLHVTHVWRRSLSTLPLAPTVNVDLNGTPIDLSSTVCNLGVTIDQNLSFQQHVSCTSQFCYLNCVESILSITTCHKMLSRHWSLLLFCPESITAIIYSLAVLRSLFTIFKKFRTTLQGSSVELLSLIIYLPSFTLFTGFCLYKELNTNCFSLPSDL